LEFFTVVDEMPEGHFFKEVVQVSLPFLVYLFLVFHEEVFTW